MNSTTTQNTSKLSILTIATVKDDNIHFALRSLAQYSQDFADWIIYTSDDVENDELEVYIGLKPVLLDLILELEDLLENDDEHDEFDDSDIDTFKEIYALLEETSKHTDFFIAQV
jgi:hypothetical protein